jgi:hypothetical protein
VPGWSRLRKATVAAIGCILAVVAVLALHRLRPDGDRQDRRLTQEARPEQVPRDDQARAERKDAEVPAVERGGEAEHAPSAGARSGAGPAAPAPESAAADQPKATASGKGVRLDPLALEAKVEGRGSGTFEIVLKVPDEYMEQCTIEGSVLEAATLARGCAHPRRPGGNSDMIAEVAMLLAQPGALGASIQLTGTKGYDWKYELKDTAWGTKAGYNYGEMRSSLPNGGEFSSRILWYRPLKPWSPASGTLRLQVSLRPGDEIRLLLLKGSERDALLGEAKCTAPR